MDLDEFRTILGNSRMDIWGFIETAIKVASLDYGDEIKDHRDGIVAKLYANCPNCDAESKVRTSSGNGFVSNDAFEAVFGVEEVEEEEEGQTKGDSPYIPVSIGVEDVKEEEGEEEHYKEEEQRFVDEDNGFEFDEERTIISIKEQIEDPNQTEDSLVDLLQTLADMDITFKALKETDIGRHVNRLRKHPSNDVKQLVKLLVRKWKDLVDDWVTSNNPADGDSRQQNISKNQQNSHHNQVPDFGYSPNPHNGNSGSDKSEYKPKVVPPRGYPSAKPIKTASPTSAPPSNRQKQVAADPERLASARKRLQENYQKEQNAKKQRTIQVMDIHELPKGKAKNSFGKNKSVLHRR